MIWQDGVLMLGQLLFAIALIPALKSQEKPPRSTCLMTAIVLMAFATVFGSLHLLWSTVTTTVAATMWGILYVQGRRPRWRHLIRGTVYEERGCATLRALDPPVDGDTLMVYQDKFGGLWARPEPEFRDGRFVEVDQ